jgi:hypothetical protein
MYWSYNASAYSLPGANGSPCRRDSIHHAVRLGGIEHHTPAIHTRPDDIIAGIGVIISVYFLSRRIPACGVGAAECYPEAAIRFSLDQCSDIDSVMARDYQSRS